MNPTTTCQYFALCTNDAVVFTTHFALHFVPSCERCAKRFDLDMLTLERDGDEFVIKINGKEEHRFLNQVEGEGEWWSDFDVLDAYFYSEYGVA